MQPVFIFWNRAVYVPCVRGVRKKNWYRGLYDYEYEIVSVGTKYNTYTWCLVLLYSDVFIQGQTSEGLVRPRFFLYWAAPSEGRIYVL